MGNSSSSRSEVVAPSSCPAIPNASTGSACPVVDGGAAAPIYNVYNQQINSDAGAGMFPGEEMALRSVDLYRWKDTTGKMSADWIMLIW
eukprot:9200543-Pyramimonas_sp.AAC.2